MDNGVLIVFEVQNRKDYVFYHLLSNAHKKPNLIDIGPIFSIF